MMKEIKDSASPRNNLFSPNKLLEKMGIHSGEIMTPEKLARVNVPIPSGMEPFCLVMKVSQKFLQNSETIGGVTIRGRVYTTPAGRLIVLIRVQAGDSLAGMVIDATDGDFMRLLKARCEAGYIPLICRAVDARSVEQFHMPIDLEYVQQLIDDTRNCARCSDEEMLARLAASAVWLYENEMYAIDESIEVDEALLSIVIPDECTVGMPGQHLH